MSKSLKLAIVLGIYGFIFWKGYKFMNAKSPVKEVSPITNEVETVTREVDILARTAWGEARGEGREGIIAVMCVILNRVAFSKKRVGGYWWGSNIIDVCLKAWQFSCWNKNDPNSEKCKTVDISNPQFRLCLELAKLATTTTLKDVTNGATHYHIKQMAKPSSWGTGGTITARIGNHIFYKDIA